MWFKIYTGEGQAPRRLKLSLITRENAHLIFVDRKGEMIIDKQAEVFCQEIKDGLSCLLEDHSIFDQALSQVISQISQKHK